MKFSSIAALNVAFIIAE